MKKSLFFSIFFTLMFHQSCKAQEFNQLYKSGSINQIDTLFFPFYKGVQMIEVDLIKEWDQRIYFLEQSQPRAIPHSQKIPMPEGNEYFFRDSTGTIVKAFNTSKSLQELNDYFKKISIDQKSNIPQISNSHRSRMNSNKGVWVYSPQPMLNFEGHYRIVSYIRNEKYYYNNNDTKEVKPAPQMYGLIDSLGNIKIPAQYDAILPLNRTILASKNRKWGVMDYGQNEIVPYEFTSYQNYYSDPENNGHILFSKGFHYYRWNSGADIISGVYDVHAQKFKRLPDYHYVHNDQHPLIPVYRYGKLGFLNADYDEIIPPVYELSTYNGHHKGLFRVAKDGKYGFIDRNAKEVIPLQFDYAEPFSRDSVALVLKNGRLQCINPKGKKVSKCDLNPNWEVVSDRIQPGFQFIRIGKSDYRALYDSVNRKFALPFQLGAVYPVATYNPQQFNIWGYSCEETNKNGLINLKENKKSDCLYQYIREAYNGYAIVRNGDDEGVLDADFEIKIDLKYKELRFSQVNSSHLYFRNEENQIGIMDLNEKIIVPPKYTYIYPNPNYSLTRMEYSYGILDRNGNELIPCIYDEIGDFGTDGLLIVKKEKKYGVVDYRNNIIVPMEYDIVYPANRSSEGFISVYRSVMMPGGYTQGEHKQIEIPKK